MAISFYDISIPQLDRALAQLQSCLAKGSGFCTDKKIDEAVLTKWRLYPDMLAFDRQVQIACDFTKFFAARLTGTEAPKFEAPSVEPQPEVIAPQAEVIVPQVVAEPVRASVPADLKPVEPAAESPLSVTSSIDPGPTDTGWMGADLKEKLQQQAPTGRVGLPDDAAHLVLFLASDEARWVTGQILRSRGGF